jgi:glutathione peroxidase
VTTTLGNFTATDIDGGDVDLSSYDGKVVLVVNTASQCGMTPQYAGLQELYAKHKDAGLVVVGVPSNDFGAQEPGAEPAIKSFCQINYDVDFPLTAKQTVIGGGAHPFYRWVVAELGEAAAPKWNFHKYLVAPDGTLAGLWPSAVDPLDRKITDAIEAALT